jgi:CRISPR/Cas system CSM-associated protein Csm3 (group 7 of RAMP superfamily)
MPHRLRIELKFILVSGFHITGEQGKLFTDKALVVDWHEGRWPVIPATTLKGWLRENAERLLRGLGQQVYDGSRFGERCGRCPVCELFGWPRRRSPLRFSDAKLGESMTDVRMNVSLSRYRKTAYEERLFSTEVAWQKELTTHIEGWFDSREEAWGAATLLYLAARLGFAIGAARSRGLGWLKLDDFVASVDGGELKNEDLVEQSTVLVTQTENAV